MRQTIFAPWDGHALGEVELADEKEADRAIENASKAFDAMHAMPSHSRRDALKKIALAIETRAEEIATALAREAGKPIVYAKGEVARAVSTFSIAAEEATRLEMGAMDLD